MNYGWHFTGTDIDPVAIESAAGISQGNARACRP
jgi:23S rRNA A1618 N6-methylase RlmF